MVGQGNCSIRFDGQLATQMRKDLAENFRESPIALEALHVKYPDAAGPPKRLDLR